MCGTISCTRGVREDAAHEAPYKSNPRDISVGLPDKARKVTTSLSKACRFCPLIKSAISVRFTEKLVISGAPHCELSTKKKRMSFKNGSRYKKAKTRYQPVDFHHSIACLPKSPSPNCFSPLTRKPSSCPERLAVWMYNWRKSFGIANS